MFLTVVVFIAVLASLILVHELGHFLLAKKSNIKVEEFGIGFPPKAWSKKIGETIYSLNWLPLGGFVKMLGEEKEVDDERSYSRQSIWTRTKVVAAGVIMNFLFGLLILAVYLSLGNPPIATNPAKYVQEDKISYQTVVFQVKEDSQPSKLNLEQGDIITAIDKQSITKKEQLINYIKEHEGKEATIYYQRAGKTKSITATLTDLDAWSQTAVLAYKSVDYSWWQIPILAVEDTFRTIGLIFSFVYFLIAKLVSQGKVMEGVTGPVGIYVLTSQVVQMGISPLLRFIAFLSINLGVVNLLPIPALDGGQLVLLLVEKIRGKKPREEFQYYLQIFGFSLIILIFILITYRDVVRLF